MRLSDLRDKTVRTLDGEKLGRVHEIHCKEGLITALTCGPGSFLERLTAKKHGRRIPWKCVRKVTDRQVLVTPEPQPTPKKPSGSRTPRRTRRPNAQPSKR